jgi:acetate---CoA ligase (ADP-forming)
MAKEKDKRSKYADLNYILSPKSVAVIGASDNPAKVGHVIMQNYLDIGFSGGLYPININSEEKIMGLPAYKKIGDVKKPIDLAVISIPAEYVPATIDECGKSGVKGIVIVSSGFAEVGNMALEDKLEKAIKKWNIPTIGPNCLGVMDPRARNDTLFLPTYKIDRPKVGTVSFASQSGSVGSSILDLISGEGFGLSKFISYGNALMVDEVDVLNYLAHDEHTKVILYYMEGAKRGKEFIEVAKKTTKLKPVVIIKGGVTTEGAGAAHSHTASLAGSHEAYEAVFRQYGFTIGDDLDDLLYFGKIFDTQPFAKGNRIAILTNGGGHGVLATDAIYQNGLKLAELSKNSQKELRKAMPPIVNIRLPLDMSGEADAKSYSTALDILSNDPGIDAFMTIALFQTPGADEKLASSLINYSSQKKKPMVVVSTGGTYTKSHVSLMESSGVPVYDSPTSAARSLAALINYSRYRNKVES